MDNEQDCYIVFNEFELQSRSYVLFRTNIFDKGLNFVIPSSMG